MGLYSKYLEKKKARIDFKEPHVLSLTG